jgi:hypothetical protein
MLQAQADAAKRLAIEITAKGRCGAAMSTFVDEISST